jgi:hypothetical protein
MQGFETVKRVGAKIARAAGLQGGTEHVLAHGRALAAEGRYLDAIDYATAENRRLRDTALERQIVIWRHDAFGAIPHPPGRPDWPPNIADPFPTAVGLPEIQGAQALTAERLGGAILHHGGLIVRGLLTPQEAQPFVYGIDKALAARAKFERDEANGEDECWYSRFPVEHASHLFYTREFAEQDPCVLTADSPRNLAAVVSMVRAKGADRAIEGYLGERPALSIGKSTLRRVPPRDFPGDWHQDGAFLGETIRTVNFWLCLSHCGQDASGLGMVPRRLSHIVETGTPGAHFHWSVSDDLAVQLAGDLPIASRIFQPGDAVFFDQMNLHRTEGRPGLTKTRYAIESWFFAPSTYPTEWGPLVV